MLLGPPPHRTTHIPPVVDIAFGVETDRHVLGPVLIDKEQAAEQHPLVIESGIGRTVRRDVRFDLLHPLSWQQEQEQRRCQRTVYADAMTE